MKDLDLHYKALKSIIDENPFIPEQAEKKCTDKITLIYNDLSKLLKENKVVEEEGQPQEQPNIPALQRTFTNFCNSIIKVQNQIMKQSEGIQIYKLL